MAQVLEDSENYGVLNIFTQITKELPGKQMESLETIFASMQSSLYANPLSLRNFNYDMILLN